MFTPQLSDHVLIFLFVVGLPVFAKLMWYPRLQAAVARGEPHARMLPFVQGIIVDWALTLALLYVWRFYGRFFSDMALAWPSGVRGMVGMGIALLLIAAANWQRIAVLRSPEQREKLLEQMENVRALLPDTRQDLMLFFVLSITAGFCEEVFFRGALIWYLGAYVPKVAAYILATVLFGAAHFYQGAKGIVQTGLVGGVMLLLVLISDSLWPAIVFHAAFDINNGWLGYSTLKLHEQAAKDSA